MAVSNSPDNLSYDVIHQNNDHRNKKPCDHHATRFPLIYRNGTSFILGNFSHFLTLCHVNSDIYIYIREHTKSIQYAIIEFHRLRDGRYRITDSRIPLLLRFTLSFVATRHTRAHRRQPITRSKVHVPPQYRNIRYYTSSPLNVIHFHD